MSLDRIIQLAIEAAIAIIRQLPAQQQATAFDATAERLRFEAEGQRKLLARKRRRAAK